MKTVRKSSLARVLQITTDVVWYLCIVTVVFAVVIGGVSIVTRGSIAGHFNMPVLVDLDPSIYSITAKDLGIGTAELQDVAAELRFRSPGDPFFLFFAVYLAIAMAIVMAVLYQLRNILGTLVAGNPFVAVNAVRIRFIGWVVILGEVVQSFLELVGQVIVKATFETTGVSFRWTVDISLTTVFWGLVLLALAEVFRLGVHMREEQSLTV